jgi:hypothetical protein
MVMKTYLEWLPNRFKRAREEGLLDDNKTSDRINEWAVKFNQYSKFVSVNKFKEDPFDEMKEYRVIVYNTDFNSCQGFDMIHEELVIDLANKGYPISREDSENWWQPLRYPEIAEKFICMYAKLRKGIIGFSASYEDQDTSILYTAAKEYHSQAIAKTGLKLVNKRLWFESRN